MKHRTAYGLVLNLCLCSIYSCCYFILSYGCVTLPELPPSVKPSCGHLAVLGALTYKDALGSQGTPFKVRIVVGPVSPGMDHAQAQVLINGKWWWLEYKEGRVFCTDDQDDFESIQFMDVEEFIKRYYD